MPDISSKGLGGLILAGGRGSRMQEADKGWIMLVGQPLVAHVARRLAPQVQAILVSANRNADRYAEYGQVLADDPVFGDWSGPLAGVLAGLRAWQGEWLVVAPCDTPFLPRDMAARLIAAAQAHQAPLAVVRAGGRRHSVCMALCTSLQDDLRDYLQGGDRKVELWQTRVGGIVVDFDDTPHAFLNINTPDDLAAAVQEGSGRQ
jgi:molybdopterin-guanine dinucleotide biosynthesis protein A